MPGLCWLIMLCKGGALDGVIGKIDPSYKNFLGKTYMELEQQTIDNYTQADISEQSDKHWYELLKPIVSDNECTQVGKFEQQLHESRGAKRAPADGVLESDLNFSD